MCLCVVVYLCMQVYIKCEYIALYLNMGHVVTAAADVAAAAVTATAAAVAAAANPLASKGSFFSLKIHNSASNNARNLNFF